MITTRWQLGFLVLVFGSVAAWCDGRDGTAAGPILVHDDPKIPGEELAADDGFAATRATPGYKAAYRKARNQAETSLKDGRGRLFSYGMLGMSDLDPETGLAVKPLSGCVVTHEILGRTEGNNDHVRGWVKKYGPTSNSLVRWKDELSDLSGFFAARAKAGATISLRIGGPTLASPDGRFTIRQVATRVARGTPPDVRMVTTIGLEVSERGAVQEVLTDDWGDGLTDLAWGPSGAPFAVVKTRGHDGPDYQIIHFRPVDWVMNAELGWQRYLKEHPESPLNKPDQG